MFHRTIRALAIAVWLVPCAARAQNATNVLIVINEDSPQSRQIGARYAELRRIPDSQIVRLKTTLADEIDRARFDAEIERPIFDWMTREAAHDRILYVVLTKGIPLRISGTGGLNGTTASVDSEVTLLYRKLLGVPVTVGGRIENPYFHGERPLVDAKRFSHAAHDTYLVTRLDGFALDDVFRIIERGTTPTREGLFVFDQRADSTGSQIGDKWLSGAAERLTAAGLKNKVVLDATKNVVTGLKPVIGYYSWGSTDPAAAAKRRLDLGFVPGSLAATFVSTDGRTFNEPPATWTAGTWRERDKFFEGSPQSLAGDLIREGATGVASHVAEPFLDGSVRPQTLFPAYVAGFNLAESFYLAMPFLSWQNLIVGDPLCAPFTQPPIDEAERNPPQDPQTELPAFFSARRLAVLAEYGIRPAVAMLLLKASARLMNADPPGARAALEAVTVLEPGLNVAHFVLAGIYDTLGEHDLAIERYQKILSTAATEVRSLNNLAYTLAVNKRQPQAALPLADRAYRLAHEREAEVVLDPGYSVLVRKGTPAGMLPFAPEGYTTEAIRAQIADTLGWIHHLLADDAQAEKFLDQAVKGAASNAEIVLHVGIVQAALGRTSEARATLDRAITLDPGIAQRAEVRELRQRLDVK